MTGKVKQLTLVEFCNRLVGPLPKWQLDLLERYEMARARDGARDSAHALDQEKGTKRRRR